MNLREQILNSNDIKKELVTVAEWGNAVIEIRTLTGKARANMLKSAVDKNGNIDFEKIYPEIIIASSFDPETGSKLFESTDRDIINSKSAKCVEEIAKVALRLAGLDTDSREEIVKN